MSYLDLNRDLTASLKPYLSNYEVKLELKTSGTITGRLLCSINETVIKARIQWRLVDDLWELINLFDDIIVNTGTETESEIAMGIVLNNETTIALDYFPERGFSLSYGYGNEVDLDSRFNKKLKACIIDMLEYRIKAIATNEEENMILYSKLQPIQDYINRIPDE